MHRYPTPHTWMHRNHHPSSKCTDFLPLTHECTENCHSSGKCTDILPLTHECTEIIIPQVNALISYPSHTWIHRNRHSSGKYTNILPLTHECTEIIIPQVNAQESYPSHMNAPIVTPQVNALTSYPCVRGRILGHLPEEWRLAVHSCVRGKISVHLLEGGWFPFIHVWGVGHCSIYQRNDDFGAFMCEG